MTEYHISEAVEVLYQPRTGKPYPIKVCPECAGHERGNPTEYIDCKNVFWAYVDGEKISVGQCLCYGPAHGRCE